MNHRINQIYHDSIKLTEQFFTLYEHELPRMIQVIVAALKAGRKLMVFGNGGSAADAQHLAAELVNKFLLHRKALPALALTTDTSTLTSIANDMGYDFVFSRQLEALGAAGDIALGISTSGNSPNVMVGLETARKLNLYTITLLGGDGGQLRDKGDMNFIVPSKDTPRIQEVHAIFIHVLCELVELAFRED